MGMFVRYCLDYINCAGKPSPFRVASFPGFGSWNINIEKVNKLKNACIHSLLTVGVTSFFRVLWPRLLYNGRLTTNLEL